VREESMKHGFLEAHGKASGSNNIIFAALLSTVRCRDTLRLTFAGFRLY
jgi:hypothetical protein